jgi:cytochrome c-L
MYVSATAWLGATSLAATLLIALGSSSAGGDSAAQGHAPLDFTHVLDDSPLDVLTPRPDEVFTEAVAEFHVTGSNPYSGEAEAIAEGRQHYNRWCQACHMPDGSGRMGPSLIDDTFRHERAATDKGFFEIVYGGAAGAMQTFGDRLTQDDILRMMAYVESLGAD